MSQKPDLGACCAPSAPTRGADGPPAAFRRTAPGSSEGMVQVPAGEFLMGTDGDYGFPADGEGPAHPVDLLAFSIDAACVTNRQFSDFVNATGYRTEAERFGWSFVFHGHLTAQQLRTAVRLVVQGSPWWCRVDNATWRHPEGPGSHIKQRWSIPSSRCRGGMRAPMRIGRESAFRRRLNGSAPRGAVSSKSASRGATSWSRPGAT